MSEPNSTHAAAERMETVDLERKEAPPEETKTDEVSKKHKAVEEGRPVQTKPEGR
jgi:hypothetical protein